MNLWSILFVSAAAVGFSKASTKFSFDKVKPFKELDPVTYTDKSGVRYKPSLIVTKGCHSYPAVDASGRTSAGDEEAEPFNNGCLDPTQGDQVYGRAIWHKGRWAIMYAWYFPMDNAGWYKPFFSHDWASIVVWIDNPAVPEPTIIGVATSWFVTRYKTYKPLPPKYLDGNATRIEYRDDPNNEGYHSVDVTTTGGGKFQQLIMWDQMTDAARNALNTTDFGPNASVPLNDINFKANLDLAWLN